MDIKTKVYKTGKKFIAYDPNTGEEVLVPEIKERNIIVNDIDEFMLVYTSLLAVFVRDRNMTMAEVRVYAHLLIHHSDCKEFAINRGIKQTISDATGVGVRTIDNCLMSLRRSTEIGSALLLYNPEMKVYYVNPEYAYKGSSMDRKQTILKLALSIKPDDI